MAPPSPAEPDVPRVPPLSPVFPTPSRARSSPRVTVPGSRAATKGSHPL
ncbi:hypothetical protein GCM10009839_39610 [Catenulispora yoronensis]|uniref:Uncharacterized protein n=1 Tax=Catenulispora yoronensis TaxID=450799 RepID=A0ABP5FVI8_9ACTN